ncbi:uncharacterized protein [Temnothorax nylanderi]|uniref:uncharacterized protein n=1 Tax=Temnothorax nylanderi TaxID=102681 RepID=UPI003A869950
MIKDFLADEKDVPSKKDKVKNIMNDDSWYVVEKMNVNREQVNEPEMPTKPLPPKVTSEVYNSARCMIKIMSENTLATARIRVRDRFGVEHIARALVDQGTESSLVSESLVQRLKLLRSPTSVAVFGVGGKRTGRARGRVALDISPRDGGPSILVLALILPRLTFYGGGVSATWPHLHGLELADPDFSASDPVEMLLGADVFAAILQPGLLKDEPLEPVAQQTTLGWIISGAAGTEARAPRSTTLQCHIKEDLSTIVKRFWQQEELPAGAPALTPEDRECERFFCLTHSRTADGRYMVRLPVVDPLPDLRGTRSAALRALAHMEKRFARDDKLKQLYVEFMRQYEELGHMTPVAPEDKTKSRVSYLPHHGVMREASTSTKLRVVFNGSTSLPSGDSLNKCLRVGPNLLPNLADVLLRWRRWRYVLATDMEKMYRQILVDPEDRDLQRIFWRYKIEDEILEYLLNTVTYGLTCAPFLAMRSVKQLAEDEKERFPLAAIALLVDRYMDDVLSGANILEKALALRQQLSELCMAGGFPLRKWSANEEALLTDVTAEHRMQRELRSWRPQESHATLGLQWHPCVDSFSFSTKTSLVTSFTKRSVLSLTARVFDPLGWLAPVVVSAKILFQATWLRGLDWDDPLSETDAQYWRTYQAELPLLEEFRVPRRIYPDARGLGVELHGFADASEKAYAAVIYLRAQAQDGSWLVTLLAAKTKVAPLKIVALPRLELDAAALLARLAAHTKVTLELPEAPLNLWSDAMVALGWIRGHPTRWKTYVANRAFSDDPDDLAVLTPGHFLVGSALIAVPEPSLLDVPVNRLIRWQLLQQMRDHFWKRWSQEYGHSLVHRPKWQSKELDIQLGRLCLLRNETTPPTKWPLA